MTRQQRRYAEREAKAAKSREAHKVVVRPVEDATVSLKEFKQFAAFAYGPGWRRYWRGTLPTRRMLDALWRELGETIMAAGKEVTAFDAARPYSVTTEFVQKPSPPIHPDILAHYAKAISSDINARKERQALAALTGPSGGAGIWVTNDRAVAYCESVETYDNLKTAVDATIATGDPSLAITGMEIRVASEDELALLRLGIDPREEARKSEGFKAYHAMPASSEAA